MKVVEALVALTLVGTLQAIVVPDVIDVGNSAITELNRIGRGERVRQEQIRVVVCEAFPNSCPEPVQPWVDAPLLTTTGLQP